MGNTIHCSFYILVNMTYKIGEHFIFYTLSFVVQLTKKSIIRIVCRGGWGMNRRALTLDHIFIGVYGEGKVIIFQQRRPLDHILTAEVV